MTTTPCEPWQGAMMPNGYGTITVAGRTHLAHRWAYEQSVGPIPDGLHIDHLCRHRACVNPEHLEPVTQAENNRRAADAAQTCRRGHLRTPENTTIECGFRRCLDCRAAKHEQKLADGRRYRRENPEKRAETQRRYRAKVKALTSTGGAA